VEALVREAPDLKRWKIIPFKPAREFAFGVDSEGIHLDPKSLVFEPLSSDSNPSDLGIRVYVPMPKMTDGVRKAAVTIRHIDAAPLVGSPDEQIPLVDLPAYINWFRAQKQGS
jgi:hypothetical protein